MSGKRLHDYQPPAFLADTVELRFDLHPRASWARAALALRRAAPGPLWLDAESLDIRSIALDGALLSAARLRHAPGGIKIIDPPDVCVVSPKPSSAPPSALRCTMTLDADRAAHPAPPRARHPARRRAIRIAS